MIHPGGDVRRLQGRRALGRLELRPSALGRDAEIVLAVARFVLSGAMTAAVLFERRFGVSPVQVVILGAYVAVSFAAIWTTAALRRATPVAMLHLADIAFASFILSLGDAATPLFVFYYSFCLLSAAAHWNGRAVLLTGGALGCVYALSIALEHLSTDRFVTRSAYMLAAALLIARAIDSVHAIQSRLLKLARWASGRFDQRQDAVKAVLRHAGDAVDARNVIVFWREIGASGWRQAVLRGDELTSVEGAAYDETALPERLRGRPFLLVGRGSRGFLTYSGPVPGDGVPDIVKAHVAPGEAVASNAFRGDICEGRIFAAGIGSWRWRHLIFIELVSGHVLSRLEGRLLRERQQQQAAQIERVRVARDIHDGLLQSLTAARLQLQIAANGLPPSQKTNLHRASEVLRNEQSRLREFVEGARSRDQNRVEPLSRLGDEARQFAQRWELEADVQVATPEAVLPYTLMRELSFLLAEGVANAARHGTGRRISIDLSLRAGRLLLHLENPVGPDKSQLEAAPRSMSDRAFQLGGTVSLEVEADLVSFLIELPVHA